MSAAEKLPKIEYDNCGRMRYHPDYHEKHRVPFTEEELEYMCKFYEVAGRLEIAMALGRTEATIASKIHQFRKDGRYEYYKNLNKHY